MAEDYKKIHDWYMTNIQVINKLENMASKHGISFIQYSLLLGIMNKSSTPLDIAKRLRVSKTTVSRALKTLQTKDLVVKTPSTFGDSRSVEIGITDAGIDLVENINEILNRKIDLLDETVEL